MIPLSLEITAFGPFSDTQKVDFSQFAESRFFLITGPTGSGKTSIFDAISFALYGVASGNARESDTFKSDFAPADRTSRVVFSFLVHDRKYRVEREPIQWKLRRDGSLSKANSSACLYEEEQSIATGASAVDKKIEEIIGLTAVQFKKIVMLPQGEFRQFLEDPSQEKQKLLRRIFSTELLERFTLQLRQEASGAKKMLDQEAAGCQSLFGAVIDPAWEESLSAVSTDFPYYLSLLHGQNQAAKKEIGDLLALSQNLEERRAALPLESAREQAQNQEQLETASAELEALHRQSDAYRRLEEEIQQLIRLRTLPAMEQYLQELHDQNNLLQEKHRTAVAAVAELEAQLPALADEHQAAVQCVRDEVPGWIQLCTEKKQQLDDLLHAKQIKNKLILLDHEHAKLIKNSEAAKLLLRQEEAGKRQQLLLGAERLLADYARCCGTAAESAAYYSAQLQRFIAGQAGMLAKGLSDGTPCPVCGSTHHPAPACELTDSPSSEQLQRDQQAYESAGAAQRNAEGACRVALSQLGLLPEDGKLSSALLPVQKATAETALEIESCKQQLKKLDHGLPSSGMAPADLLVDLADRITLLEQQKAVLSSELENLIQAVSVSQDDLEAEIADLSQKAEQAIRLAEDLAAKKQSLTANLEGQQATTAALHLQLQDVKARYEAQKSDFQKALSGLSLSLDEYGALKSRIDLTDTLQKHLTDYKMALSAKEAIVRTLQERLQETPVPDIPKLEQEYAVLTEQIAETADLLRKAQAKWESNRNLESQLVHRIDQWKKWREKATRFQRFYDVANGQYSDHVDFERYILAGYFDDVLQNANIRLEKMTNSRYTLRRRTEKERFQRSSGLALEVLDMYTGKARHSNTLSGGESFKVSLCLALGLADVISENAGGIQLSTLFIDEGFGSLDAVSLQQAMDCLISLQADGRYIGIISHVSELKELIPDQIRLEQTPSGSKIHQPL